MKKFIFIFAVVFLVTGLSQQMAFSKEKSLPKFVGEVLRQMPQEHRVDPKLVVFLEKGSDLDNLNLPVTKQVLATMKAEYAAFQKDGVIYICGWSLKYTQSEKLFSAGHSQSMWVWVGYMAHERFHTQPHPGMNAQQEEVAAYSLQLVLVEQFEKEGKFAGMLTYISKHKDFLRGIISGSIPAENYVLMEKPNTVAKSGGN